MKHQDTDHCHYVGEEHRIHDHQQPIIPLSVTENENDANRADDQIADED